MKVTGYPKMPASRTVLDGTWNTAGDADASQCPKAFKRLCKRENRTSAPQGRECLRLGFASGGLWRAGQANTGVLAQAGDLIDLVRSDERHANYLLPPGNHGMLLSLAIGRYELHQRLTSADGHSSARITHHDGVMVSRRAPQPLLTRQRHGS
jgi:hypothetical protein